MGTGPWWWRRGHKRAFFTRLENVTCWRRQVGNAPRVCPQGREARRDMTSRADETRRPHRGWHHPFPDNVAMQIPALLVLGSVPLSRDSQRAEKNDGNF